MTIFNKKRLKLLIDIFLYDYQKSKARNPAKQAAGL
jgi:hypothetical protein